MGDEMKDMIKEFKLENIEIERDVIDGKSTISSDVVTKNGSVRVCEWINNDGRVERGDSNIYTNEAESLATIFDMSDRPAMAPIDYYLPIHEIHNAMDAFLRENFEGYEDEGDEQ